MGIPIKENEIIEEWRYHPKLGDNYLVSNTGIIKSISRYVKFNGNLIFKKTINLKYQISKKGYYTIRIDSNGIKKTLVVHRLVAQLFVPNPFNLPQVNHKDLNKLNNNYTNFEWNNNRQNTTHYRENVIHTSIHVGVHWNKKDNIWVSQIYILNKKYTVGSFKCQHKAKEAYELALKNWNLNRILPESKRSSKYKNISFNKRRGKWHAYSIVNSKIKTIGFFETEEEANLNKNNYDKSKKEGL